MAIATVVHVRVDETIKVQATAILASIGLSVSDAVRIFLTRIVADNVLPFEGKMPKPNAASRRAIAEAKGIIKNRRDRFASSEALGARL